ncbi:hypothetical protein FHR71_003991 [Methylobacterium sp. RAS18]|nr:hypothetical protein [Methylobacterium sp. RAS18]
MSRGCHCDGRTREQPAGHRGRYVRGMVTDTVFAVFVTPLFHLLIASAFPP